MTFTYLTEVAQRERLANQARTTSLLTWACSLVLVGLAMSPIATNKAVKFSLFLSAAALTAASRASAGNLAEHDRVLQDYRDTSDHQRQQAMFEALKPQQLLKPAEAISTQAETADQITPIPTHNISRAIASQLKSTVLLGAPRAGKGYSLAHALALLPPTVDLWLIDPKDDPEESYYWLRIPVRQRTRFDVTTLDPAAVDAKVSSLFEQFLLAPSTAAKPKLLIVDECAPGLAKGMTSKAYKAFMGRLSTICSVGPSKGKFVWVMAQSSTVDDLAMSNGNKASFRLAAVGHAQRTERSWYRSLQQSMGIDTPSAALTGYIQMLNGQWGYSEPFTVQRSSQPTDSHRAEAAQREPTFSRQSREALSYFQGRDREHITLRQLTQASFARRENLTSQRSMMAALAPLLDAGKIAETADGAYLLS